MNTVDSMYTDIAATCNQRDKSVRVSAWENGRDLYIVREALKAQKLWVQWCEKHLDFTRATATNYISLYLAYPECKTILQDGITLSMAYEASHTPDPAKAVEVARVQQKAKKGAILDDNDLSIALDNHGVNNPDKRAAIRIANEVSPQTVRDIIITGAITNLDGEDIPIAKADTTLIQVNAETEARERKARHLAHKTQGLQDVPVVIKRFGDEAYAVLLLPADYPVFLLENYIAKVPKAIVRKQPERMEAVG